MNVDCQQYTNDLLDRSHQYVGDALQHHAGLDSNNHGLRHLLWMGMTRQNSNRWTCQKLEEEMRKLFNAFN